jgi:hypothetical protein
MEGGNDNEITVGSMEELKELIRALPEGMVLSVALEKEGGDGDKKGFQA